MDQNVLQFFFKNSSGYEYSYTEAPNLFQIMMTSSNGNIFRLTGPLCGEFTGPSEFPAQRPVTRGFDVFFDLRPNKRLSKQPWGWWFETPSWSLWSQCNVQELCGCLGILKKIGSDWQCYRKAILDWKGTWVSSRPWGPDWELRLQWNIGLSREVITCMKHVHTSCSTTPMTLLRKWSFAGQLGVAYFNSLSHVCNLKLAIFKLMSMINIFGVSCKVNAPHWWLVNVDSGNGLVPSGNSHYLSQCWPRSMSPHGVTTPQWVNGFYFRSFVSRLPGRYMHTMMTVPGRSLVTSQVQLSRHE